MSKTHATFGVLKKVVQAINHIRFSFVYVAAMAIISTIIITTSTTR